LPKLPLVILFATSLRSTAPSPLDPLIDKINPDKWYEIVEKEPSKLEEKLISKSEKTLPLSKTRREDLQKATWDQRFAPR
jgi:hypothetical protein